MTMERTDPPQFGIEDICRLTGVSRSTALRRLKSGEWPAPAGRIQAGSRGRPRDGWSVDQIAPLLVSCSAQRHQEHMC